MAAPPPNPSTTSHLLTTHRALIDTITSFLTVLTHHILYLRHIYPPISFLSTRAYNYPVRQNRHPAVITWVNDAITAINSQLTKNTVSTISLCIYDTTTNHTLERWVIDLSSLPSIPKRDRDVPFDLPLDHKINLVDLEATFRATLSRISSTSAHLKPLPSGANAPDLSYTLTIEVRDSADRPVGRLDKEERKWIVAEPDSFTSTSTSSVASSANPSFIGPATTQNHYLQNGKTTPIRRLALPPPIPLSMELWVEESAHKFGFDTPSERTPAKRAAEMSYGAGTEKYFDVNEGYEDLEGTDVNRKPGGGVGLDYRGERR